MSADLEQLAHTLMVPAGNRDLLRLALTHRSALNEDPAILESNERLEFLGDAVLELAMSDYLYRSQPHRPEGQLTTLRAAVVRQETLARVAQSLNLGTYLHISHGEDAAGGRQRPSILASTLEAVIGAIYLDRGWEAARALAVQWLAPEVSRVLAADAEAPGKDAKSRLQELAQASCGHTPVYRVVRSSGPDHAKEFEVEVVIGGEATARGTGLSKQQAEQAAAGVALERWSCEAAGSGQSAADDTLTTDN